MSLKNWFIERTVRKQAKKLKKEGGAMGNIIEFLEGKKTYAVMVITAVLGAIDALQQADIISWQVPGWIFPILAGLGILTRKVAKPK